MNPISLSNSTLINLLNRGGYAIISPERNPTAVSGDFNLSDDAIKRRLGNLSTDLTNIYLYSNVLGKYDGSQEDSFLVILHNTLPEQERGNHMPVRCKVQSRFCHLCKTGFTSYTTADLYDRTIQWYICRRTRL